MEKQELISKIRGIIHEWGPFTVAELEGHTGPIFKENKEGKVVMERFDRLHIGTTIYVDGKPVSDDFVHYDDLTKEQLDSVLYLATEFDTISWKTSQSINDYDW